MITIIGGEDTAASRKKFADLRALSQSQGKMTVSIDKNNLPDLNNWLSEAVGLFFSDKVFFAENILSQKKVRDSLKKYEVTSSPEIIIWEERLSERDLKSYFKKATVLGFKLPESIFTLLDALTPGNLPRAHGLLLSLAGQVEEPLLLYMVHRRIRDLIVIGSGLASTRKLAPWQESRLSAQALKWPKGKLEKMYQKIYTIEVMSKTAGSAFSTVEAIDILFCYYL